MMNLVVFLSFCSLLVMVMESSLSAGSLGPSEEIARTIIAMEKAALSRWVKGDPGGFLEIVAEDVVYFDPMIEKRLDGREALEAYYGQIPAQTGAEQQFELLNPLVQVGGNMAVLTFNYVARKGDETYRWNCTEVYRQDEGRWRIIQTHWSLTQPKL